MPSPALPGIGLFVLLVAASLPFIDFCIVNVALPAIGSTPHASAPALELAVAGYGTAYALLLIVGGRLGDAYGRRRVFTLGLTGLTVTCTAQRMRGSLATETVPPVRRIAPWC